MTSLQQRDVRLVWRWCLLYTALTPSAVRHRRRAEMLAHLWESEHTEQPARTVLAAAARGVPDDVTWLAGVMLAGLGRLMRVPMTYLVIALAFPIQGWVAASVASSKDAQPFLTAGTTGGGMMLLVAGALAWVRRARS